jgi:leader peptidase (prepilin peptidase)/N-methyltransferase
VLISELTAVTAFVVGAIIGSFLNVVIHRLPRGVSLVRPPSHCPHCGTGIAPWQNIPLFSYLFLGGRCRHCRGPISPRYPLVETANALLYLALALRFGIGAEALVWAAYGSAMIAITGIDIDHKIIPDAITLPGIVVGLATTFWLSKDAGLVEYIFSRWIPLSDFPYLLPLADSFLALLLGGGFFYIVAVVSDRLLGKPGMGGGDIKMAAMMGSFLGLEKLAVAVFVALLSGSLVGITLIALGRKSRKDIIPFGPFLALGAVTVVFFGEELLNWYLRIHGF